MEDKIGTVGARQVHYVKRRKTVAISKKNKKLNKCCVSYLAQTYIGHIPRHFPFSAGKTINSLEAFMNQNAIAINYQNCVQNYRTFVKVASL